MGNVDARERLPGLDRAALERVILKKLPAPLPADVLQSIVQFFPPNPPTPTSQLIKKLTFSRCWDRCLIVTGDAVRKWRIVPIARRDSFIRKAIPKRRCRSLVYQTDRLEPQDRLRGVGTSDSDSEDEDYEGERTGSEWDFLDSVREWDIIP
jgi:hypothetical protein